MFNYFFMIFDVPTPKSDCTLTKYTPEFKSETLTWIASVDEPLT